MRKVDQKEYNKRVALHGQGLTYHEIADRLNISYPGIASWFRHHGFKANKPNDVNGEHERRYKAYLEADNDIMAAELCGMRVKSFRMWRNCHHLPSKQGRPNKPNNSYVSNRPEWERNLMRHFGSHFERMNSKGDVSLLIEAYRDYYGSFREEIA